MERNSAGLTEFDTLALIDLAEKPKQINPPPPDHLPLFASIRWPGQAGLTSAGSVAAGSDGCLLGRIHFPCGESCMCFCVAEVFFLFSHCTPQGA